MQALEGIKILNLTRWGGPGPFRTMILADLGAEVIKIEAPPKAGSRQAGLGRSPAGESGGMEVVYNAVNRNKKSACVNLRSDEDVAIFHQLSRGADIIVEGFRPGVVKKQKERN